MSKQLQIPVDMSKQLQIPVDMSKQLQIPVDTSQKCSNEIVSSIDSTVYQVSDNRQNLMKYTDDISPSWINIFVVGLLFLHVWLI